jgi:hypothetical protein
MTANGNWPDSRLQHKWSTVAGAASSADNQQLNRSGVFRRGDRLVALLSNSTEGDQPAAPTNVAALRCRANHCLTFYSSSAE